MDARFSHYVHVGEAYMLEEVGVQEAGVQEADG